MSRRNNVRGPTSALTEFLKESGITPTTIARRAATQNQNQATAGPSRPSGLRQSTTNEEGEEEQVEEQNEDATGEAEASRPSRRRSRASGYVSDDLDDEPDKPAPKKRKLTKAAEAKLKVKAKEAAKKKKGKKGSDDEDEEEDAYTALSKSLWTNSSSARPPVGGFENCAECNNQFTVTKYTMAANSGKGYLCHKCAKASGSDPFKKAAPPKKRKPVDKRQVVHFEERRFPTLASMCIQIICRHIEDVEALGDIGAINMQEICKAICKSRSLTVENAPLFYDVSNTKLRLYDATNITPAGFSSLALLNPNLTSLRIDLCGCLDDTTIATWCTALPSLTHLDLEGPFLVRVAGWKSFFKSHPQLEGFLITQSPRFDLGCVESLVTNCPNLKELRLREIGKMSDEFVTHLKTLQSGLTLLDLSEPGESLSEDALIELVAAVGSTLVTLELAKHDSITEQFLSALRLNIQCLGTLDLSYCPLLTDNGVAAFFESMAIADEECRSPVHPPLQNIDLSRNHDLANEALAAILTHSGPAIVHLNINGWKGIGEPALTEMAKNLPGLRELDVGWCREMDDFVVKGLMDNCPNIKALKVWGCNRLTTTCPRKRGVNIYGIEALS